MSRTTPRHFSSSVRKTVSGFVLADHRLVRRDHDDLELVDLVALHGLGVRGTRHSRELVVHPEVVLERDRGEGLALALDLHPLLRLDRLVQAVAPATARHDPAGELVDDDHLAFLDHVVDVALEEDVGLQRLVDVVDRQHVRGVVEVVDAEKVLAVLDAAVGERDRTGLLVDHVVARVVVLVVLAALDHGSLDELRDDLVDPVVEVGRFLGGTRDDQRRPGLVDEDRVHLIDDREPVPALDHRAEREFHVVAQVVEPELVVRAVGDVGAVGLLPLLVRQVVLDAADRHAEEAVEPPHPLGVAAGEVVVDGDDVHALSGERVQEGRERRDQRLALAGAHLGDLPLVEDHPADQLHVEVAHAEDAFARFSDDREHLGEKVVERRALGEAILELALLGPELGVGDGGQARLERVDALDHGPEALQGPLVLRADDFREHAGEHESEVYQSGFAGPSRGGAATGR